MTSGLEGGERSVFRENIDLADDPGRFGAGEIHGEKPVHQFRTQHLHAIREQEGPLELPRGDAAMEILDPLLGGLDLALHEQHVLMRGDLDVALAEAGDGHGDPILVLPDLRDVVGRVGKITTRIAERLLETGRVDAVLATASDPEDRWAPQPVIVTRAEDMSACRGMKMGYSPLLALLVAGMTARARMQHALTVEPHLGSAGAVLNVLLFICLGLLFTLDGLAKLDRDGTVFRPALDEAERAFLAKG